MRKEKEKLKKEIQKTLKAKEFCIWLVEEKTVGGYNRAIIYFYSKTKNNLNYAYISEADEDDSLYIDSYMNNATLKEFKEMLKSDFMMNNKQRADFLISKIKEGKQNG